MPMAEADEAHLILDDRDHPIVRLYPGRVTNLGLFGRLCTQWDEMLARDGPFIIISFGDHPANEPREVAHERALFFKRSRDVFRQRCTLILNVEPDPRDRALRLTEVQKVTQAVGFRIAVVATEAEALRVAHQILSQAQHA